MPTTPPRQKSVAEPRAHERVSWRREPPSRPERDRSAEARMAAASPLALLLLRYAVAVRRGRRDLGRARVGFAERAAGP